MITRIEIDGFKTFDDFSLDVPPFLVLLGANGSGKSNLLEAVVLLGRLMKDSRGQTLVRYARRGGPRELFRRGPGGDLVDEMRLSANVLVRTPNFGPAHVRVDATVNYREAPEPLHVRVDFTPIGSEGVELPSHVADQIDDNVLHLLHRLPDDSDPVKQNEAEREIYGAVRRAAEGWRILDPSPDAMRHPADAYDSDPLTEDGRNLGAVLGRLWDGESERKSDFEADVAAVLPDIREIDVVRDEDRALWEIWIQHKHEPKMTPRVVSGGTLRMLALLAAAHDPAYSGVLMLEEPENGLHPSRVPRLLERLKRRATELAGIERRAWYGDFEAGSGDDLRQILVTSHSPVVLASLRDEAPHNVVFLDTVTRVGGGQTPSRLTRARTVAADGERGTYVTPLEVRQYLDPVGYARGA
ncbi:AAA family ATPase [Streptomyces sp. NPDC057474]|uniref:AAA family ATPase n=1 Tax=Streptomyces sp. NPDC057474 TaxID=3346144 RepID=UPI003686F751